MFVIAILFMGTIGKMTVNAAELEKESNDGKEDIQKDDTESKQAEKDSGQENKETNEQQPSEDIKPEIVVSFPDKDENKPSTETETETEHVDECDKPHSKACKESQQDNNDMSDEEVAKKDAKDGGDLTVILKLKYSSLDGKWFKKVHLDIGKYFSKFYDLSGKPSQIKLKHLDVPEGRTFKVSLNNYGTDDGEQWNMRNSVCKCPETVSIKVP